MGFIGDLHKLNKQAKEIRLKIHRFLARYLRPPRPLTDLNALNRAAYPVRDDG